MSPQGAANTFTTIPFDGTAVRTLSRLPGVSAVGVYRGGFLDWGDRRVWVLAPPRTAALPDPGRPAGAGRARVRHRRDPAGRLGGALAGARRRAPAADRRALHAALAAPTVLRVAALSTNLAWPSGAVIVNAGQYARAWGSPDASAYQVQIQPGVSPAAVSARIQRVLGPHTALVAETAAQRMQANYATTRQSLSRLAQIGRLVLIAAVLAMAGAMGSMIWQRRPQLAYIKRQGYKRGVLWRALLCESALLLSAGCSLGAGFGIYGQLLLSHALASVTGFPIVFSIGGVAALTSFALVSAAAVAILALPGYLAVRVRPTTVSAV